MKNKKFLPLVILAGVVALLGILLAMALDTGMTALERSDARALQRL